MLKLQPSLRTTSFLKIYIFFIYLFLEKGREGERERNINVWLPLTHPILGSWPTTQACALTGNQTSDSGSQASIQSTEPHQPGLRTTSLKGSLCGWSNSKWHMKRITRHSISWLPLTVTWVDYFFSLAEAEKAVVAVSCPLHNREVESVYCSS